MNPLSRLAAWVTVAVGVLISVAPVSGNADPSGGVIVILGFGNDLVAFPVVVVALALVLVVAANRIQKRRCS